MKKGLAAVAVFCLVLGFQNCSQNSMHGDDFSSSSDNIINVPAPVNAGGDGSTSNSTTTPAKVTYVEIPNIVDSSSSSSQKAAVVSPYRLVVSTQSGSIQLMDDANDVLQTRCLSAGSLQELKNILTGASVCSKAIPDVDVCSAVYTPGYASLFADGKRVNLGESRDSCGTGRKDLCGTMTDVFQGYVAYLKAHWSEMECQ